MFWCDQLVEKIEGQQTINDSKTPSGRAHVGALRGPLIHDAIFRTLKAKGVPVRYLFGVDDYDPVEVHDIHATVLHLLGIDHERLTYRHAGRDFRLTDVHGTLIKPILA